VLKVVKTRLRPSSSSIRNIASNQVHSGVSVLLSTLDIESRRDSTKQNLRRGILLINAQNMQPCQARGTLRGFVSLILP
jgi:hypothetical protein